MDRPFPLCVLSTSVISAGHSTSRICATGPHNQGQVYPLGNAKIALSTHAEPEHTFR